MSVLKLKPSCKDYLWGGHRLVEEYGKEYDGEILAETWELSCHPDGPSTIINGRYAGKLGQCSKKKATSKQNSCKRYTHKPIKRLSILCGLWQKIDLTDTLQQKRPFLTVFLSLWWICQQSKLLYGSFH